MKKFIYSFYLLLCVFGYTQTYTPLLDNRNEWHLISCYMGDCFRDTYYTDGDTIVNGQQHKILDGYHYISRTFLLRENLAEKKVYLTTIIQNRIEEHLLYDFNLSEGDTINLLNPITPFPPDGGYFRLDSIRIQPILNDEYAKFYYFSPTPSNTESQGIFPIWVEGVGSLSIVTAPGGHPDYDGVGKVSCFFKNSTLFYFDDEMTNQCNSMSVQAVEQSHSDLQFAINNSKGILKSNKKINHVEIYDLTGRKIRSIPIRGLGTIEFDLHGVNKGNYVLVVYGERNRYHLNFILK